MAELAKIENWKENQNISEKAQPGDMIEFIRGVYSHWAIYIGNGVVIHRWGEGDGIGQSVGVLGNVTIIFGVQFNKAKISESQISDVLKYGGKVRVNNYLDFKYKPLPVEVILDRARSAVNQEGYNVIYTNCEHFSTDCRYGQPNSRQVQVVVGGSLAAGILITVIVAASAYFLRGSSKKEEKEENNLKEIEIKI